jgi:integrase
MIDAGVPLDSVSDRLGHSSVSITHSKYVHGSVERDQAAGEALERFIGGG